MDPDYFLNKYVLPSTQQRHFIHFTDSANVPSIAQHGLLSMRELKRRDIETPVPGGNEWSQEADAACGMDAYVHLCFKTGHPMEKRAVDEGRISNLRYLQIEPSIIKLPGVKITTDVSNKRGVIPGNPATMLDELDLEVLYTRLNWNDPPVHERLVLAEKAELLVPRHIPLDYILNI